MPDKAWKHAERRAARDLGGRRRPSMGESGPDIDSSWLCPEVKYRKRLPVLASRALEQAERSAKEGQLPIAVLMERGKHSGSALVVMRLKDFQARLGWPKALGD